MRAEIERSMNLLVTRTEGIKEGEGDTNLLLQSEVISYCQSLSGQKEFQAMLGNDIA